MSHFVYGVFKRENPHHVITAGVGVSERTIYRYLKKLQRYDIIIRIPVDNKRIEYALNMELSSEALIANKAEVKRDNWKFYNKLQQHRKTIGKSRIVSDRHPEQEDD